MGVVQANNDGGGEGGLVNREISTWDEGKEVRNGMVGEGQGLGSSEEDEPGSNEIIEDANKGSEEAIQVHDGLQNLQQQSQGSTIHWDRFLPIRSLKVLLVENDDSTRHVVTALLRNCSYEVTAVANSLQAWKILEDLTNHIDLILTEVVMPFISGISLLCKIMSHKTFKNIPVIMMSSHDSMGIVFKCLSKGAVDFLVKPIRKNELKNLWQHVWRRCHSSSGSGSESGTQTKKSVKSKSNVESENNTGSSDEHDNGSTGTSIRDGSDNGSGTQNSWTRRAAEVDSPQPLSPMDQLADAPDSTCAQVIHTKPETLSNQWVHVIETKECQGTEEQLDNVAMGRDLELGVARNPDVQLEYQHEKCSTYPTCKRQNKLPESDSNPFDKGHLENNGASANSTDPLVESRDFGNPIGLSDVSQIKDKGSCETREQPTLDLSLKRLRGAGDVGACVHDDRNSLRHSDLSAFSKYNTASSANQAPTGNVGSCSPLDNSSVAMKTETINNFPSHVDGNLPNQQSNGSSNNIDMASTTNYAVPKPEAYNEKSESTSAFKCFHTSAFQPVTSGRMFPPQKISSEKADDIVVDAVDAQAIGSHQPVQVQHHHHHYHHYHHHVHSMQPQSQPQPQPQQQQQSDNDDRFLNNMAAAAPQCGSSNAFGGPAEGNAANYSINGSASGSNHGSNGQNGSSTALNVGATNMEGDNGAAGNSGAGAISGKGSGNRVEEDRFAQREAALTKFRQKRKERCFEKKVRYQSRKKLAEQRPRIRGQFVRQNASDSKAGKDEPSDDTMSANNSCDGGLR